MSNHRRWRYSWDASSKGATSRIFEADEPEQEGWFDSPAFVVDPSMVVKEVQPEQEPLKLPEPKKGK